MALVEAGKALGDFDIFPFVERAAGFLDPARAPITHQERWEENAGYSPSTLAAVIAGLICAAEIARDHDSNELASFLEDFADWIERHLEDWTVTTAASSIPDVKRHYMRIRPPEDGEPVYNAEGRHPTPFASPTARPARALTSKPARSSTPASSNSSATASAAPTTRSSSTPSKSSTPSSRRELPQGPGWLRYNHDGYGQRKDGGPFIIWGQGRVWPLLTGERAHYELAAGKDISGLIATSNASDPRQYDARAGLGRSQPPGCKPAARPPAGSAYPSSGPTPSTSSFSAPPSTARSSTASILSIPRYCDREGPKGTSAKIIEIFTMRRPIQRITAGQTLRIHDGPKFDGLWSTDGWETTNTINFRSLAPPVARRYPNRRPRQAVNYHGLFTGPSRTAGSVTMWS